jgi:hypothetical protein
VSSAVRVMHCPPPITRVAWSQNAPVRLA